MPAYIQKIESDAADIPNPPAGSVIEFVDIATGEPSFKNSAGVVTSLKGADGVDGDDGDDGAGLPTGGTIGQIPVKLSSADFDIGWGDSPTSIPTLATYTANQVGVLADEVVQMNVASANTYTIPTNASVAYPIGKVIEVWQMGAGQTTISDNGGAITILYHADLTLKLKGQNSGCSLRKVATNTWRLIGDMEPV